MHNKVIMAPLRAIYIVTVVHVHVHVHVHVRPSRHWGLDCGTLDCTETVVNSPKYSENISALSVALIRINFRSGLHVHVHVDRHRHLTIFQQYQYSVV